MAVEVAKRESRDLKVHYEKNGYIVRDSSLLDVRYLQYHLRRSDLLEIWRSHRYSPEQALTEAFEKSDMCFTVENGRPIMMFGCVPRSLLGGGIIWLLSSDDIDAIKLRFLRNCRKFVDIMVSNHGILTNHVDAENTKAIQWLRFLGADISPAQPYGSSGMPFHRFTFSA